ncbi:hypothetical protein BU17DRAFT_61152 [Hysterangium stoloniferum]|nr:hypothetical protein BU17DRAFT_61152 [Hysterangium stoloniferum]
MPAQPLFTIDSRNKDINIKVIEDKNVRSGGSLSGKFRRRIRGQHWQKRGKLQGKWKDWDDDDDDEEDEEDELEELIGIDTEDASFSCPILCRIHSSRDLSHTHGPSEGLCTVQLCQERLQLCDHDAGASIGGPVRCWGDLKGDIGGSTGSGPAL